MKDLTNEFSDELESLHEKAMDMAEDAFFLEREGKKEEAIQKYYSAFIVEKVIADTLIESNKDSKDLEPLRSILCTSTANLAKSAGQIEEAKKYFNKIIEFGENTDLIEEAKETLKEL